MKLKLPVPIGSFNVEKSKNKENTNNQLITKCLTISNKILLLINVKPD